MRKVSLLAALISLAGCQSAGRFLQELLRERPPSPLAPFEITSDARVDSAGRILGSFVGEGTSRQVHLLSSDTALIARLARRYGPERARRGDVWEWLARQRVFVIDPQSSAGSLPVPDAQAGSPDGHTTVRLVALILRGSDCGWRGAQAELVVEDARGGGPSLRGPVLGSFRAPGSWSGESRAFREPPAPPSETLTRQLLANTERVMDSLLTPQLSTRERPLGPVPARIEINSLEDIDAADVLSFQLEDGRVRYAVSLRERRTLATGDTVLTAGVMVWDSSGAWRQAVFRPTMLELRRGRLSPRGHQRPGVFWRRLDAVSGFAFGRDYLWMEQVNVEDGSILWGVVEPRGNAVVAAAEVDGPCE